MADVHAEGYMSLLETTHHHSEGRTGLAHGLRHDGTFEPIGKQRLIAETYWNPAPAQTEFTAGQWRHLVITVDRAAQRSKTENFHIDGDLKYTATDRTVTMPNASYRIGGFFSGVT